MGVERTAGETNWVRTSRRGLAILRFGDLRPGDRVLDVGCSHGQVSLEVAPFVGSVHGLDISPDRVARASWEAARQGIGNATFESVAVQDYPLETRTWDVSLFLRTWGKGQGTQVLGGADFGRVLRATRRQVIARAGVPRHPDRLSKIIEICDANDFDVMCFMRPNLIIANRRGGHARIRDLPEQAFVLTQAGVALVPAASLGDHPVVRSLSRS